MKKVTVLITATALCGVFSSAAFAAVSINSTTSIGGGPYTPSTKVGISVLSAPTSYAATACHLNGSLQYGTGGGKDYTDDPSKIKSSKIEDQASTNTVGVPKTVSSATALPTPTDSNGWQ